MFEIGYSTTLVYLTYTKIFTDTELLTKYTKSWPPSWILNTCNQLQDGNHRYLLSTHFYEHFDVSYNIPSWNFPRKYIARQTNSGFSITLEISHDISLYRRSEQKRNISAFNRSLESWKTKRRIPIEIKINVSLNKCMVKIEPWDGEDLLDTKWK